MKNRYEMKIDGELIICDEDEMKKRAKELFNNVFEDEKQYIEDEELGTTEEFEEMLKMDIGDIYDIEENQEILFGRNIIEYIKEFDYYLSELLEDNGINYDKSTMSNSTYVEINGKVIRISDHKQPMFATDYGHKTVTIDLIYKDEIIDNEDLKKYLNIDINGTIIF